MQLVESYLNEVGRFVPDAQRDEILMELRDALLSEIDGMVEDQGEDQGEDQREDDTSTVSENHPNVSLAIQRAVLTRFGHPLQVASRYQSRRYLIGPALYPAFVQTLKFVLVLTIAVQFLLALAAGTTSHWQVGPVGFFTGLIESLVWVLAVVVLVFIGIEYSGEKLRWYEKWTPKTLPSGSLGVIRRGDVITNLITEGFFLLWWNDVVVLGQRLPGDMFQRLADVWTGFYWELNVIVASAFLLHFYVLVRGVWQQKTLVLEVVINVATVALLMVIISHSSLVVLSADVAANIQGAANHIVRVSMLVIIGFCLWDIYQAIVTFRGTLGRLAVT